MPFTSEIKHVLVSILPVGIICIDDFGFIARLPLGQVEIKQSHNL